ncbi:lipid II:glycine glycyltransferase FemX [Pendulispora albinea]|uniref:GNAT family N-acetyltransferase n=1 Tax=Pendulispora albinea TaxID=2741071 RepID=A0ABZ2LUA3_9BACT
MRVMLEEKLSPEQAELYDRFIDEAQGGHYSQTRVWSEIVTAGRPLAKRWFLAQDGGKVVGAGLLLRPRAARLIVAPVAHMDRGPVCADPERMSHVVRALVHTTRLHGIARLSIMPYWSDTDAEAVERALARDRFTNTQKADGAHINTLRLPLGDRSDAEILAGGDRATLRRKLKQAEKAGARARMGTSADMPILARLYGELMSEQSMNTKTPLYFSRLAERLAPKGPAALFLCEHEGETVAAALIVRHGAVATFVIGATDRSHRTFSKMALPFLAAIRWARDEGCATFDLGGIPMPGDTDEKRRNIAQFKFDFDRTPVKLVSEHTRWF